MNTQSYRLFFAIELSPDLKRQLLDFQDSLDDIEGRAVAAENLHITLSFLGQTTEKRLEAILDNLRPVSLSPFSVPTTSIEYWPKPKVVSLAIDDNNGQLALCKKQIEEQLSEIDFFSFEKRSYRPHITLFRSVETPPKIALPFTADIPVHDFSLMQSQNSRSGVQYQAIESWPIRSNSVRQQLLGK